MSAELWWANILQGSLGAVIGLVGLFGVFWLTRRHELTRDASTRKADEKRAAMERTEAGVVRIIEAANEIRLNRFTNDHESIDALCHALTVFNVKESADHPDAAQWAFQQSTEILSLKKSGTDIRAAPRQAGMISGSLMEWSRLRFPPDFFAAKPDQDTKDSTDDPPHEKNDVKAIIEQLDREGVPASHENIAQRMAANTAQRSRTSGETSKGTK